MASIKHVLMGALIVFCFGSCTKYNYIDGGKANGVHDCTMWEYFHKDRENWDSLILMTERAELRSLFDGTGEYGQITFFGPTNLSIERHIQNHNKGLEPSSPLYWNGVKSIPAGECRDIILKLVVPRRFLMKEVPRGLRTQKAVDGIMTWQESGGMECEALRGSLFVWTQRESYNEVEDAGAFSLWIASQNQMGTRSERIASSNIQTTTGVVHSLNNDFRFNNF